jgi:methyl-accepting chemotaxis protein
MKFYGMKIDTKIKLSFISILMFSIVSVNTSADELLIRSEQVRIPTEEQRNAVGEVMKSITNINDLVQSTAAGAEQMTSNANRLAVLAENLLNKVSFFATR